MRRSLVGRVAAPMVIVGALVGCGGSGGASTSLESSTTSTAEVVVDTTAAPTTSTEVSTTTVPPTTTSTTVPVPVMPTIETAHLRSSVAGAVDLEYPVLVGGSFDVPNQAVLAAVSAVADDIDARLRAAGTSAGCPPGEATGTMHAMLVTERVVSFLWEIDETMGDCGRSYGRGFGFVWDLQEARQVQIAELFTGNAWRGALASIVFQQLATDPVFQSSLVPNDFQQFYEVCHGAISVDGVELVCDGNTVDYTQGIANAVGLWFQLEAQLSPLGAQLEEAAVLSLPFD